MAVVSENPLVFRDLGARLPILGNPDGVVSGQVLGIHDASGGNMTMNLTGADAGEVLLRLHYFVGVNLNNAVTLGHIQLAANVFNDDLALDVVDRFSLAASASVSRGFAEGMYFLVEKTTTTVVQYLTTNINGAIAVLQVQGVYWYMSRLRDSSPRRWDVLPA